MSNNCLIFTPGISLDVHSEQPHTELDQNQQPQEKLEQDEITPGMGDSIDMEQQDSFITPGFDDSFEER